MAVDLENSFTVPLSRPQTWQVLLDVNRLVSCMPGAALTEIVNERTFLGTVSIRLGPVSLSFKGKAEFTLLDKENGRIEVFGTGTEGRGRGRAEAKFHVHLVELSAAETRVNILSNINLAGSIAQYGRGVGMIKGVSEEIVSIVAENLRNEITRSEIPVSEQPATAPRPHLANRTQLSLLSLLTAGLKRWLRNLVALKSAPSEPKPPERTSPR